jgi:2-amino-4-hydroxy-6-hydroxymethyldihydropteridine diphosphokinase
MDDAWSRVYIGLGSNLGDPVGQIIKAFRELSELPDCRGLNYSSLYRTRPIGPQDQADFINAVATLSTRLGPESLLDELQRLERLHRRIRERRWGPRTLDLDLLLYDQRRIETPRLVAPHPEMGKRAFVLVPLMEITSAEFSIPGLGMLGDLLAKIGREGIERLV